MKKTIIVLLIILCLLPFNFSDIGPSPSYLFEINNLSEYSEYDFYSVGNINTDKINDGVNYIYKLDTYVKIVAVSKNVQVSGNGLELEDIDYTAASESISIKSGTNTFSITNLDPQSKILLLNLESNVSDTSYGTSYLMPLLILIVIVIVVGGVVLIVKKQKNQTKVT